METICFLEFCELLNWGGGYRERDMRIPEFIVSQAEVAVTWAPHLQLASEVGAVL